MAFLVDGCSLLSFSSTYPYTCWTFLLIFWRVTAAYFCGVSCIPPICQWENSHAFVESTIVPILIGEAIALILIVEESIRGPILMIEEFTFIVIDFSATPISITEESTRLTFHLCFGALPIAIWPTNKQSPSIDYPRLATHPSLRPPLIIPPHLAGCCWPVPPLSYCYSTQMILQN